MNLEYYSAAQLGKAVNSKVISPTEVVDYFEGRIKERNPSVNAFTYTRFDDARVRAKEVEKIIERNGNAGPFAGVPFALKDFLPSKKGWTHSHGGVRSYIMVDPYNSEFCSAMERAGGVAVGKTNSPSFGFSGLCYNKMYGFTCNPFDLSRNSGGSSGGSAAAVADGMVLLAEGGDAGGSIRIPAAWCNCFGYKASVGTIPSVCRPDAWAATHPYCFNGGITKTVEDAAILLNYMAHYNSRDPLSIPVERLSYVEAMHSSIKGMKIAFTYDFGLFDVVDEEIAAKVYAAAKTLENAGATVEIVPISINRTLKELAEVWCTSISIDTSIEMELNKEKGLDLIKDYREDLPASFVYWNDKALKSTVMDYYKFNVIRTELYDLQARLFSKYDALISPVSSCLPVQNSFEYTGDYEYTNVERLIGFAETFIFNFTGNPAASIPVGLSKDGLPIGMQIVGRRFDDETVFAIAGAYERINPWNYDIPFNRIEKEKGVKIIKESLSPELKKNVAEMMKTFKWVKGGIKDTDVADVVYVYIEPQVFNVAEGPAKASEAFAYVRKIVERAGYKFLRKEDLEPVTLPSSYRCRYRYFFVKEN